MRRGDTAGSVAREMPAAGATGRGWQPLASLDQRGCGQWSAHRTEKRVTLNRPGKHGAQQSRSASRGPRV